jgi:hypothetical protein
VKGRAKKGKPRGARERELLKEGQAQLRRLRDEVEALRHGVPLVMIRGEAARAIAAQPDFWQRLQELPGASISARLLAYRIAQAHSVRRRLLMTVSELRTAPTPDLHLAETGIDRARRAFELLEVFVPRRICNEEIGDAMEVIHRMVSTGRPRWMIRLKIVTTYFWVLTHSGLDYAIKLAGAARRLTRGRGGRRGS